MNTPAERTLPITFESGPHSYVVLRTDGKRYRVWQSGQEVKISDHTARVLFNAYQAA